MKNIEKLINVLTVVLTSVLFVFIIASCGEQGDEETEKFISISGNITLLTNSAVGVGNVPVRLTRGEDDPLLGVNTSSGGAFSFVGLSIGIGNSFGRYTIDPDPEEISGYVFTPASILIITDGDVTDADFSAK